MTDNLSFGEADYLSKELGTSYKQKIKNSLKHLTQNSINKILPLLQWMNYKNSN